MSEGAIIDEFGPRYPIAVSEPSGIEPPAEVAAHELNASMAQTAGQLNAVHASIVDILADALESGAWAQPGVRSPAHWLTWQLGITSSEAHRFVKLAEARHTHPVVSKMFSDGRLSATQAALATSVEPHRDAEIAEVVVNCTIPQLRLFARTMRNADDRPAPKPPQEKPDNPFEDPPKSECFDWSCGDDGWGSGRFQLDPEHTAELKAALTEARDLLFHNRNEATDPDRDGQVAGRRTRWVDAFVEMIRRSLDAETSASRRDRFRVNLFIDPSDDLTARWHDRGGVPDWLRDKVTCDGTISPVFVDHGKPVAVGRTQRIVPERTRRLVLYRDGHKCRIPWCERTRWLDIHHVLHWSGPDHGPTDPWNLVAACDWCHDAVHRGDLHISGNADDPNGLVFTDRNGFVIDHTPRPSLPTGPPPQPKQPYQHPLGERLRPDDIWVDPSPWRAAS